MHHDVDLLTVQQRATMPPLGTVCRLGLATRGNGALDREAVLAAMGAGVNYLNWCGRPDGMRDAIRRLGPKRKQVYVAVQLEARCAADARRELAALLGELGTDYLDVVTYYYVEHPDEWDEITRRGGAADAIEEARGQGTMRAIGLTSHQRRLAARAAQSGRLDLLMVRYNAAHRGAEHDVFPITVARGMPVVAFTCLRWGALLEPTPADPPGFVVPRAPDWYRFVLAQPAVGVALMAPANSRELTEDLHVLSAWRKLSMDELSALRAHGDRVRRHAGRFP